MVGSECGARDTLPALPGPEVLQGHVGRRHPAVVRDVLPTVVYRSDSWIGVGHWAGEAVGAPLDLEVVILVHLGKWCMLRLKVSSLTTSVIIKLSLVLFQYSPGSTFSC